MTRFYFVLSILSMFVLTAGIAAGKDSRASVEKRSVLREKDSKWRMVWQDEFSYTGLPDPEKWGYEVGFVRNRESQYYTRADTENVFCRNGLLEITARLERIKNEDYKPNGDSTHHRYGRPYADYTSASINTLGKASWTYGRIEVSARLPQGQGVWPAIWMMGIDRDKVGWPRCGEIDIMEYVNSSPDTIFGTVHFFEPSVANKYRSFGKKIAFTDKKAFHLYALEWDEKELRIYFDDVCYFKFENKPGSLFHKPYYLLLNFAVGGAWGGPPVPSVFPQTYQIDFVRVYERKN